MVINRKGTALEVDAVLPAIAEACETWDWRQRFSPEDEAALVRFLVSEANTLTVRIYEVHPSGMAVQRRQLD
jgi:hypothetical protein